MTIAVRRLEPRDHDRWQRLFHDYIAFYRAEVPDDVIALTWQRIVGPKPEFQGFAAVDADDVPFAFAIMLLHRSTWSATGVCYLEDLYVDAAGRGRGAGRALIEAVYREADAQGATRTYWVTETDNVVARRLYDGVARKFDYVQYRRVR